MDYIEGIFLTRANPVSFGIRLAIPRSITTPSRMSHVVAVDGDWAIEATMLHGVHRVPLEEALKGTREIARVRYQVPNAEAGLRWLRATAARRAKYDFKGALGLGLAPGRSWQDESDWFCFELFAKALAEAGRTPFVSHAHVTGEMLLALPPLLQQPERTTP
jgi:hypothetical protein